MPNPDEQRGPARLEYETMYKPLENPAPYEIPPTVSRRAALALGGAAALASAAGVAVLLSRSADGTSPQESGMATPGATPQPEVVASTTAPAASETVEEPEKYPEHTVIATVFGIGEAPSADNAYISNEVTAWDEDPERRFGGPDDMYAPRKKDGTPAGFKPKHNPYYFALPASEFTEDGEIPGARQSSPWADEASALSSDQSLFKGRWVEVRSGDKVAYCQWIDTGPGDNPEGERDYGYVFGEPDATPTNTFGAKAGIDISPTAAHQLGVDGVGEVTWRFVDPENVPEGPWSKYPAIDNRTYWG